MKNSQIIIVINKDRNAPIFNVAHNGIVGDLNEVISFLIDEIQKLKDLE